VRRPRTCFSHIPAAPTPHGRFLRYLFYRSGNWLSKHRRKLSANDISMGLNGNVTLPWNLRLATDFTYFFRCGYTNDAMNTDDLVWNA